MGKKYLDTKDGTLESSILGVWQEAAKKQEKLDPVGKEDGDIDNDGDQDASDKYLAKRRKSIAKAMKKDEGAMKRGKDLDTFKPKPKKEEVEESYEIGTDEYRDHTLDITPGQHLTWGSANAYKQASMKEALAKVWGLDEKKLDKSEESDIIAPVKGKKSMTGGDIAKVEVDPEKKEGK